MANIDVGGGRGGRKAMDSTIPLVPFIDLLLCCVMFLLVTAVWNQLANLPAQSRSEAGGVDEAPPDVLKLAVMIQRDGYVISTGAGDHFAVPRVQGALDVVALAHNLSTLRRTLGNATHITLLPDDGVDVKSVTDTMDTARREGFTSIAFGSVL